MAWWRVGSTSRNTAVRRDWPPLAAEERLAGWVGGGGGVGAQQNGVTEAGFRLHSVTPLPVPAVRLVPGSIGDPLRGYFTSWLSLKIGRMMLIAMKPTMPPMITIMRGSIMAVTLLMTFFSSRA